MRESEQVARREIRCTETFHAHCPPRTRRWQCGFKSCLSMAWLHWPRVGYPSTLHVRVICRIVLRCFTCKSINQHQRRAKETSTNATMRAAPSAPASYCNGVPELGQHLGQGNCLSTGSVLHIDDPNDKSRAHFRSTAIGFRTIAYMTRCHWQELPCCGKCCSIAVKISSLSTGSLSIKFNTVFTRLPCAYPHHHGQDILRQRLHTC